MREYEAAVTAGGGEPVRLAPDVARIEADLAALDGIIFSGGDDVDPARYGHAAHPATAGIDAARDAYELALVRTAFARAVPALAICRGVQVANIAFGGTLHQHVPDRFGERVGHRVRDAAGTVRRGLLDGHEVTVEPGSRLAALVGPALVTGSRHHQAIDAVAPGFRIVGRTPDGVVEAIEPHDTGHFWLGVQWHPESTIPFDDGRSLALFRALVSAASR